MWFGSSPSCEKELPRRSRVFTPEDKWLLLEQADCGDLSVSAILLTFVAYITERSCIKSVKVDHCMVRSCATVPPVAMTS